MIERLARVPIYPLFFAAFPILALFAQNAREVRVGDVPPMLVVATAGAAVAWLLIGLLLRDAAGAALVVAAAIAMFYTHGPVLEWSGLLLSYASRIWIRRLEIQVPPLGIILLELLLLSGIGAWVKVRARNLRAATRFLNVLALIAVILPIGEILRVKAPAATRAPRTARPMAALTPPPGPSRLPDIYYIILDGYARHDVLKSYFDLDNTPFLQHLEDRGFFVARRSTANYCQTPLCLSSSLNATYLDDLVKGLDKDQTALADFIGRNDVMAALRPLGYRFVTFATGFEPTDHPEADDYRSPRPHTTEFQRMVIEMTPARVIWPDPRRLDPFHLARERVTYLLDHLPDVARDPRPTFTLAHLLCPHPPIVFGANGEDVGRAHETFMLYNPRVDGRLRAPEPFRRAYRDQAAFITRRIQETIDRILASSAERPIIIVQSDHGSELNLDPESVQNTDLHERMSILNAFYFPGRRYAGLHDAISPVNTFRVVLNTFFGASLPLLPDRSFYSTWKDPYRFIDVTEAVRSVGAADVGTPGSGAACHPNDS